MAAACAALLLTGVLERTADADVTEVSGQAYGYYVDVGLFGGPLMRRGFGQETCIDVNNPPGCGPASAESPSVTLPASGSATPITATDPDGAEAQYGPAVIFDSTSMTVSTQGTTGPDGSATSTATVQRDPADNQANQNDPYNADTTTSTCTATEEGLSGTTTLANASLVLSTDPNTQEPVETIPLPTNPAPNTVYEGTIDHVGDRFRVVFNEQIFTPDAITVNAVHLFLRGEIARGDFVIASSHCDVVATTTNAAPVAQGDSFTTGPGEPLTVSGPGVLANDSDPDGDDVAAGPVPPTFRQPNAPQTTDAVWDFPTEAENGTLTLNADGSFTYTPNDGFTGTETVDYLVNDARGGTDRATVSIEVSETSTTTTTVGDGTTTTTTTTTTVGDTTTTTLGDGTTTTTVGDGTTTTTTVGDTTTTTVGDGTTTTTVGDGTTTTTVGDGTTTTTTLGDGTSTTTLGDGTTTTTVGDTTTTTAISDDDPCVGATITGTEGDDVIIGTSGDDIIAGLGGNDLIIGRGGNDVICGGAGNDTIDGRIGNDVIFGGDGADILIGGAGNDMLDGGIGDDVLLGGDGDDRLNGGVGGSDVCVGGDGSNSLNNCGLSLP